MRTQSDHRRSGGFPGRRLALATTIACVVAVGGALLPATAAADQTVVSATIFPGSQGNASDAQVMLSTLNTCGNYTGPGSITMQSPSGVLPPQGISEPAWTLGTVLTCGLQIPSTDVTAVQVVRFTGAYETPLANVQIFDPAQYPGSAGALPTIYVDGTENQTTYIRPPLSPSDPNADDNVTQQGDPVSLIVYENQQPLVVSASSSPVAGSQESTGRFTLSATVTTADGAAVPSTALTFSWTVDGSTQLGGPTPVATVDAGVTPVTVQAYDPATGTGGTYTFDITYNPQPGAPATKKQPGAGNHKKGGSTGTTKLRGSRGLDHAGTHKGAGRTRSQRHSTSQSSTATTPVTNPMSPPATQTPTPTQTTNQTTTVTTPSPTPTTTPGLTVDRTPTKTPLDKRAHAPRRRSTAQPGVSERRVTGRLVADVQALPESKSPLVHPIAAQAAAPSLVHAASDGTSAPTWAYATLAVLVLLAGGALYERRGRRGRTLHR
ncbi:MAG: hypothetical protein WAL22_01385 [Solirubrobacteraceae bacterium]